MLHNFLVLYFTFWGTKWDWMKMMSSFWLLMSREKLCKIDETFKMWKLYQNSEWIGGYVFITSHYQVLNIFFQPYSSSTNLSLPLDVWTSGDGNWNWIKAANGCTWSMAYSLKTKRKPNWTKSICLGISALKCGEWMCMHSSETVLY